MWVMGMLEIYVHMHMGSLVLSIWDRHPLTKKAKWEKFPLFPVFVKWWRLLPSYPSRMIDMIIKGTMVSLACRTFGIIQTALTRVSHTHALRFLSIVIKVAITHS